jgi:hypothetical protein
VKSYVAVHFVNERNFFVTVHDSVKPSKFEGLVVAEVVETFAAPPNIPEFLTNSATRL